MVDITQRLIGPETDDLELANFLVNLGPCQREPRNVTKPSTTYYGSNIRATSNGKGKFEQIEWLDAEGEPLEQFLRDAKDALSQSHGLKIGRGTTFFKYPVTTTYRAGDCCQIIPAPESWPQPDWRTAPHPAIIEFLYDQSPNCWVDQFRRDRAFHHLNSFFSVALKSSIVEHRADIPTWVIDGDKAEVAARCLVTGYSGSNNYWSEKDELGFSTTHAPDCPRIPAETYYRRHPAFDVEFQIPEGLTASLGRFLTLPPDQLQQYMRAAHWYRASTAALSFSASMALCGLFIAVEALMGPSPRSTNACESCGRGQQPSASRRFRDFLNDHAGFDELSDAKEILERYGSERNGLAHGDKLSAFDTTPYDDGFSELRSRDRKIYESVRHVFQIAIVNWLHGTSEPASKS